MKNKLKKKELLEIVMCDDKNIRLHLSVCINIITRNIKNYFKYLKINIFFRFNKERKIIFFIEHF